jgi:phosphatidylglycerophosphatase A
MNANDTSSTPAQPTFKTDDIRHWVAFGLGSGLSPWAPGTAGTLLAVPIYLVLSMLPLLGYLVVVAVLIAAGVWACDAVARDLSADDPPAIVWDEIVGFLVAMIAAPAGWIWVITGFVLFRLFDIYKPWPIRSVQERVRGGAGIVADDLAAGLMTFVVLQLLAMIVAASLRGVGAH